MRGLTRVNYDLLEGAGHVQSSSWRVLGSDPVQGRAVLSEFWRIAGWPGGGGPGTRTDWISRFCRSRLETEDGSEDARSKIHS